MSSFMDNLRQFLYAACLTGFFTAFISMIRWAILTAYGPEWLLHDEEDADGA